MLRLTGKRLNNLQLAFLRSVGRRLCTWVEDKRECLRTAFQTSPLQLTTSQPNDRILVRCSFTKNTAAAAGFEVAGETVMRVHVEFTSTPTFLNGSCRYPYRRTSGAVYIGVPQIDLSSEHVGRWREDCRPSVWLPSKPSAPTRRDTSTK